MALLCSRKELDCELDGCDCGDKGEEEEDELEEGRMMCVETDLQAAKRPDDCQESGGR